MSLNRHLMNSLGLLSAAALIAGCGTSSGSEPQAPPPPAPGAASPYAVGITQPTDAGGSGCARLPAAGEPGSLAAMQAQPVADAISANPQLSMVADLVRKAGLTDRLNQLKAATVFVPTNEALTDYQRALGDGVYSAQTSDPKRAEDLVTSGVVDSRYDGYRLMTAQGGVRTLNGSTVTASLDGQTVKITEVAGGAAGARTTADVVCGNFPTANATVFIVNRVLAAQQPTTPARP